MIYYSRFVGDIMSENLHKLLILDQKIQKFIEDNQDLSDPTLDSRFDETNYVKKSLTILNKMTNNDIVEAFIRCDNISIFIDIKRFLKKYILDKKKLAEDPKNYLKKYRDLNKMCEEISNLCQTKKELDYCLDTMKIDDCLEYLLKKMPNEDILILSNESTDWVEKLYYYSFFKK